MNKILVKLYVPSMEEKYDLWLPLNKKIHKVITLLIKAINEMSAGYYQPTKMPLLYNKITAEPFDINVTVKEANLKNGSEIILI